MLKAAQAFSTLRKRAAELAHIEAGHNPCFVDAALLPVFEKLVSEDAHPDTLAAIAGCEAVIAGESQQTLARKVIRFIVINDSQSINLQPLDDVELELDIIVVENNAKASLALSNKGSARLRLEVMVGDGAKLALSISHVGATGRVTRQTVLLGPGAELRENELVLRCSKLELEHQVVHASPKTSSFIEQRGVASSGEVSSKGSIRVPSGSKGSKSSISQRWLGIGKEAQVAVAPTLEIEESEVSVHHEAAVHPLDEESLFYIESRGLNRQESERLAVAGFIQPLLKGNGDAQRIIAEFIAAAEGQHA